MKRLLLLRHAKASQDPAPSDHARPLAPRGRRNAPDMGKLLRKSGFAPERVLCSASRRTRETWDLVEKELKAEPEVEFTEALYLAPWKAILNVVRAVDAPVTTLMIVGHNPGMEEFAAALLTQTADDEEQARRRIMAEKFPTGALAVIDCDVADWHALAPGKGALTAFIRPKDID